MTTYNSEQTEGIVLKTMPYQESSSLVTIYSYEFGKMTLHAQGVRKMTSKNAPGIQEMTLSDFEIVPRKGISKLIRAHPLNYYTHIKESLEYEIAGDYLLEYFYRYVDENKPLVRDFNMLSDTLEALNNGYPYLYVLAMINAYIMKINGVSLFVDGCVECGKTSVVDFSPDKGGFVCAKHADAIRRYDLSALKAIRHLYKTEMKNIGQLHISEDDVKKVLPIFFYYVEEYAGIRLKTKRFIDMIL